MVKVSEFLNLSTKGSILYSSEIPDFLIVGNLIFEKKYEEAIKLGKEQLKKNPNCCGTHINLMVAYFKARSTNDSYLSASSFHAKQAIINGHNTGLAHERLAINLEKELKINQAIQLCNIVLLDKFHFSKRGCGSKIDFSKRLEKLKRKEHKAIDKNNPVLFSDKEIELIIKNLDNWMYWRYDEQPNLIF